MLIDESTSGLRCTAVLETEDEAEQSLLQLCVSQERYFNPIVGRFISEDPIRQAGGDADLYLYVGNNPINRLDPSGHDASTNIDDQKRRQQEHAEQQRKDQQQRVEHQQERV